MDSLPLLSIAAGFGDRIELPIGHEPNFPFVKCLAIFSFQKCDPLFPIW